MHLDWKTRFKNPYFIMGLIALPIGVLGIDVQTLTSWDLLYLELVNFINNPLSIGMCIVALVGYVIDPTSKGFRDKEESAIKENSIR